MIQEETPQRILQLIRMCHPNEKGEKYTRSEVIAEIKRRGLPLLKELGWSWDLKHLYKNRYVGGVETLKKLLTEYSSYTILNSEGLFAVLENYTPIELWTDEACFDEHNPKTKLTNYLK
ncbi:MAG TPA: hypothetical protein VMZ91_10210 [Candidatus Paceibacterota bacterium]|nr:hypothetical protein [Candidatus Paceibacterota bacterium]